MPAFCACKGVVLVQTLQDLLAVGESEAARMNFVRTVIAQYQDSEMFKTARLGDEYARQQNRTIIQFQKLLYTVSGKAIPDNFSANFKMASNFLDIFCTQENQFLLGNGISWADADTRDKLGKNFDVVAQRIGYNALVHGTAYGFWNLDHLEDFTALEFAPLYDEETGGLGAGVRFWQIDAQKPLRATLYEKDGYTEYIWNSTSKGSGQKQEMGEVLQEKRAYKLNLISTEAEGTQILDGENYPSFPIVPMWGNPHHQSELTGRREQIDCYDLIKSGFANDIDDASAIYWTIENAGGMDEIDLAKFVERMRTIRATVLDDNGAKAESHTVNVPFEGREKLLERLEKDLYRDFMALDIRQISSGSVTATEINAAYELLNSKADKYEYCILDFLQRLQVLVGVDDEPSFTRSKIVNVQEEVQTLLSATQVLSTEYITEKILTMYGDIDRLEDVLDEMKGREMDTAGFDRTDEEGLPEVDDDDGIDAEIDALLGELE